MRGSLFIILFLILALIVSTTYVLRTTILVGKASGSPFQVALENSYLFASPLQAKSDQKEFIRVTVFLLDSRGLGVAGKEVSLSTNRSINAVAVQSTTDDSGKAVFDLSSATIGRHEISATVEGKLLPQKVKVNFY